MNTPSMRRDPTSGPPLGVLAVVSTALFMAGLILAAVLADGTPFPSPFGEADEIRSYFTAQSTAVAVSAFAQFAAAIPLAIYAATASARLHTLGIRAPGATIALAGGILAAAFGMLGGLTTWALSRPELHEAPELLRALHFLAFATGGPGYVVPFGLLIAGIAVPGLLARQLRAGLAWTGLVLAVIAELTTLTLLVTDASYLLPLARFGGLAWLAVAGFTLPRHRAAKNGPRS